MAVFDARHEDMQKIKDILNDSQSMYIFPHMVADGDAMGSCASLCGIMRKMGKTADIVMEDEIPDNLMFLNKDYVMFADKDTQLPKRDLCIALDCSNVDRFPKREHLFFGAGEKTACIDHHVTKSDYADINLIDPYAAATCELMYELYDFMGIPLDIEAGEALYTGIVTDTGNFQYTNTTKKTHIIAAELIDLGIDKKNINITLYQSERMEKLKLHAMIMNNMEIFCGGRAAMAYVTLDMYDQAGARTSESDGINTSLRDIKGVEVAVFLREMSEHEIKVGFRSKNYVDVAEIAVELGGGGHKHAAGCAVLKTMEEAIPLIRSAIESVMSEYDSGVRG
jgi:phosphoesterase RecJ-like protein